MTNDEIITRIQHIRSANNKQWMNLLRLALRCEPIKAKIILRKITSNDTEITRWTGRLH